MKRAFTTERPAVHTVIITEEAFHTEHPLDCDMASCDVHQRLSVAWESRPADPGRYEVKFLDDLVMLAPAKPYSKYLVVKIG